MDDVIKIVGAVVGVLARVVSEAIADGDWSVFDKRLSEVLPSELQTSIARARADALAAQKFGAES